MVCKPIEGKGRYAGRNLRKSPPFLEEKKLLAMKKGAGSRLELFSRYRRPIIRRTMKPEVGICPRAPLFWFTGMRHIPIEIAIEIAIVTMTMIVR